MKRNTIALLLLLVSAQSFAQKIVKNEIDKFTKQKRVETNSAPIIGGLFSGMNCSIRSVDTTYFINVATYGIGVGTVGDNNIMMFLLQNDSTVYAYSTGLQTYTSASGRSFSKDYCDHQYKISKETLLALSTYTLNSVRKYMTSTYADIDVPKKNNDRLQKLVSLFLAELNK